MSSKSPTTKKYNVQKDFKSRSIKGSGAKKWMIFREKVNGNVRNCMTIESSKWMARKVNHLGIRTDKRIKTGRSV